MGWIKVNQWRTTDAKAFNAAHTYITFIQGTLEEDMRDAANFFGCAIADLRSEVVEMTEEQIHQAAEAGDLLQ